MSEPETNKYANIFPPGEGWESVRAKIWAALLRRFPRVRRHELEDAVSVAMVDLIEKWLGFESSVTEDLDRNFSYAIQRGIWTGCKAMGDTQRHNSRHYSLVDEDDEGLYPVTIGPEGVDAQAIASEVSEQYDPLREELAGLDPKELEERLRPLYEPS